MIPDPFNFLQMSSFDSTLHLYSTLSNQLFFDGHLSRLRTLATVSSAAIATDVQGSLPSANSVSFRNTSMSSKDG
jgi:prepilin-type processing-associated H-X9-DG protein